MSRDGKMILFTLVPFLDNFARKKSDRCDGLGVDPA